MSFIGCPWMLVHKSMHQPKQLFDIISLNVSYCQRVRLTFKVDTLCVNRGQILKSYLINVFNIFNSLSVKKKILISLKYFNNNEGALSIFWQPLKNKWKSCTNYFDTNVLKFVSWKIQYYFALILWYRHMLHCTKTCHLVSKKLQNDQPTCLVSSVRFSPPSPVVTPSQMKYKDWGVSTMTAKDYPALPSAATSVIHTMRKSLVLDHIIIMSAHSTGNVTFESLYYSVYSNMLPVTTQRKTKFQI